MSLEEQFNTAMFEIYSRAKSEANYNAAIFYKMLHDRGGLNAAKLLINSDKQSEGYTALMLKDRLDLTVEALVVENDKWHPLFFPEELEKARIRLKQNGYL